MQTDTLINELRDARAELLAALDAVAPESMTTPGLIGEWSGRELIAHLGYWAGHATEIIHAVEVGRLDEVGEDDPSVDDVNETVARVARSTELAVVRRREEAAVEALVERLTTVDPELLAERLPDGATLEEGIREDGAGHYREHAAELHQVLEETPHG